MKYFDEVQFQNLFGRYKKARSVEILHSLIESLGCVCRGVVLEFGHKTAVDDQDDLQQEAIAKVIEKFDSFDPRKGTAFNYFTTLARRAISRRKLDDVAVQDSLPAEHHDRTIGAVDTQDGTRFGELLAQFIQGGEIVSPKRFAEWLRQRGESTRGVYIYLHELEK